MVERELQKGLVVLCLMVTIQDVLAAAKGNGSISQSRDLAKSVVVPKEGVLAGPTLSLFWPITSG